MRALLPRCHLFDCVGQLNAAIPSPSWGANVGRDERWTDLSLYCSIHPQVEGPGLRQPSGKLAREDTAPAGLHEKIQRAGVNCRRRNCQKKPPLIHTIHIASLTNVTRYLEQHATPRQNSNKNNQRCIRIKNTSSCTPAYTLFRRERQGSGQHHSIQQQNNQEGIVELLRSLGSVVASLRNRAGRSLVGDSRSPPSPGFACGI